LRKRLALGFILAAAVLGVGVGVSQAGTLTLTKIAGTWVYPTTGQRILMAGAAAFKQLVPWASAISIGLTISRLLLEDPAGNGVIVRPGSDVPYPDVPGWPDPNSPPSSAPICYVSVVGQPCQPTREAACKSTREWATGFWNYDAALSADATCRGTPTPLGVEHGYTAGQVYAWGGHNGGSCPAGYTPVGDVCELTDAPAAKWPSDGVPTIEPTGSGWQGAQRDPDPITPGLINGPDLVRSGADSYGNPQRETWHNNGDGTITGKQVTQGQTDEGTTYVNEKGITIDSGGNVTTITNTTTNNTTINNYTNSVPAAPIDLELPTDYARENTLQGIKDKLSDVPVPPAENQYIPKVDGINTVKDSLGSYTSPEGPGSIQGIFPGSGSCQQVHWSFLNKSYAFPGEVGCRWFADFKRWFGWALYVMTAIYLYRLASSAVGRGNM
jgi:hypothetical protein